MASNAKSQEDSLPKTGRVNEVCKEWTVREDGALAYRLQNEEISEHYQGNKYRNAVVREDFPRALDEQLREQQLAEQAAAVYQQMLAEQEEIDNLYAQQLAEKIEREEKEKRRALEVHDERVAYMLEKEHGKSRLVNYPPPSPQRPDKRNYNFANYSRRQAMPMPLPCDISTNNANLNVINPAVHVAVSQDHYLYTEPYKEPVRESESLVGHFDQINIVNDEVGLPLDEVSEREIQEQKDALLARQLQLQEDASGHSQVDRDRLLAIEAQDKELAKLLQERERQKVKRAKERAKQKALAKKHQQQQQQHQQHLIQDVNQIMPDDSYSHPADLLPSPQNIEKSFVANSQSNTPQKYYNPTHDDVNYSFPVDVTPSKNYDRSGLKQNYSPKKHLQYEHEIQENSKMINNGLNMYPSSTYSPEKLTNNDSPIHPIRPTQLDLKPAYNYSSKPRYPDPEFFETPSSPSKQHMNIAMAIDPTYNRRSQHSVPYCDTSSSTVTTSTSSSSPGMVLPPPDISEHEEDSSPVPPYMPIQGQRRTASLEKKSKKKSKDGCKQQ